MSLFAWILFGALAGWIASLIMRTDENSGFFMNVAIGVVGAIIGGLVMNILGGVGVTGFNVYSFLVAIMGSVILIAIVKTLKKN